MPAESLETRPKAAGWLLAALQFVLAATWTAYALYLPQLLDKAGLPKEWAPPLLLADQLIFAATDIAAALWMDRATRIVGRAGRVIAVASAVSACAFLAIPLVAAPGPIGQGLLIGAIFIWIITSAALRAPPLALVKKYAAKPSLPWLASLSALGLGLAGLAAPGLVAVLRDVDPRGPFALAALTLVAAALGVVALERRYAGQSPSTARKERPRLDGRVALFFFAATGIVLSAQLFSGPTGARLVSRLAAEPGWSVQIFWIGFVVAAAFASLTRGWDVFRVVGAAALVGAGFSVGAIAAPQAALLLAAQAFAGAAWGVMKSGLLTAALTFNAGERHSLLVGLVFCATGLASAARLTLVQSGALANEMSLFWLVPALWIAGGLVLLALARRD
jgi:hypothetical protein